MNRLTRVQCEHNTQSQGAWVEFAEHRQRVMQLLLPTTATSRGRLCVLGAGNSNDLDLETLLSAYDEVHLVDLDAAALQAGAVRQQVADRRDCTCTATPI